MMNTISIIIPAYNVEKTISACLNSIINCFRESLTEIEIIVINDGSTDNTLKILQKYNNIRILNTNNLGVSAARNLGISVANGRYIWFIDADDTVCSFNGKRLLDKIKKDNADTYLFGFLKIYNLDNGKKKLVEVKNTVQGNYDKAEFINNFENIFGENEFNVPWNKIYKRSIINRYKISFIDEMRSGEDAAFNCDYFINCSSLTVYSYMLIRYNIRASKNRYYNADYYKDCQKMISKLSMMTSKLGLNKSFLSNKYVEINKGIIDNLFLKYSNKKFNIRFLFKDINKETIKSEVNLFELSKRNRIKQIVFNTKFNIYLRYLLLKMRGKIDKIKLI